MSKPKSEVVVIYGSPQRVIALIHEELFAYRSLVILKIARAVGEVLRCSNSNRTAGSTMHGTNASRRGEDKTAFRDIT